MLCEGRALSCQHESTSSGTLNCGAEPQLPGKAPLSPTRLSTQGSLGQADL